MSVRPRPAVTLIIQSVVFPTYYAFPKQKATVPCLIQLGCGIRFRFSFVKCPPKQQLPIQVKSLTSIVETSASAFSDKSPSRCLLLSAVETFSIDKRLWIIKFMPVQHKSHSVRTLIRQILRPLVSSQLYKLQSSDQPSSYVSNLKVIIYSRVSRAIEGRTSHWPLLRPPSSLHHYSPKSLVVMMEFSIQSGLSGLYRRVQQQNFKTFRLSLQGF